MKRVGTLMLLDSVSSMNRDRVNFEDRIMSSVKWKNHDCILHARSVKGKTAPHCAELLRKRSMDYKKFVGSMDLGRAYIVLGLAEENHTIKKRWFEATLHHIVDELLFLDSPLVLFHVVKKLRTLLLKRLLELKGNST